MAWQQRVLDLTYVAAWLIVAGTAFTLATTLAGWTGIWFSVFFQGVLPWLSIAVLLIGITSAFRSRWALVVFAALVVIAVGSTLLPLARAHAAPAWAAGSPTITIVEANVLFEGNNRAAGAARLRAIDADVFVLIEVNRAWVAELRAVGLLDTHPYQILAPSEHGGDGSALLSRVPFADTNSAPLGLRSLESITVTVGARRVRIALVHTQAPPTPRYVPRWIEDHRQLERFASGSDPTIVVGDFNATYWHPPFRRLLAKGFRDAHDDMGFGLTMSWPTSPIGAMRLDHAIYRNGAAPISLHNFDVPGSDHRGFVATFAIKQ